MSKIAIVTDSTAGLPAEVVTQFQIQVVPLKIQWEGITFRDGVDITPSQFYTRLAYDPAIPITSQPSTQEFLEVYQALAPTCDGIVVPLVSSGISGTYSAAQTAAEEFAGSTSGGDIPSASRPPVTVIDTRSTTAGQAMIVLEAARAAVAGGSLDEVVHAAQRVMQTLRVYFGVDTLEFLHRGGRIGGAARFLGALLDIKPLLTINAEGKLDGLERVRTRHKALNRLVELAVEAAGSRPAHLGTYYATTPADAESLRQTICARAKVVESAVYELSPVLGVHVGPGAIGVAVWVE